MNKLIYRFELMALALLSMSQLAFAAGSATATMTNTATISGGCTISTTGFNAVYDPVGANAALPLDTTISVSTTCTTGLPAVVTLGQGSNAGSGSTDAAPVRRLSNGAGNFLNYSISTTGTYATPWGNTASTGRATTGLGTAVPMTGYAQIPAGQSSAVVGAYTDTVVATVSF